MTPVFRFPNKGAALASVLALAIATPATGQVAFDLDEITVFANRDATPVSRTGSSVIVVEEAELRRAGDVFLADFLARLPGLSFTRAGGPGQTGALRIRGAGTNLVSVFIDGIPLSDPASVDGSFDFGSLRAADIGRIEVIKGAQSALFGSGAMAGVVQITTVQADTPGTRQTLAIEAGSYNTASLSYSFTQRGARHEIAFSASRFASEGFSAADRRTTPGALPDGHYATRLSLSGSFQATETLRLGGAIFRQDSSTEFDGGPSVEASNITIRAERGARAFAEFALGASTHTLSVHGSEIRRRSITGFGPSSFAGEVQGLSYVGMLPVNAQLRLVFGADSTLERSGPRKARIAGLHAQAIVTPSDRLDITATARRDVHSDFGSANTGRLAVAYRPADGWVLRGAAATGFRAPSLFQRFGGFALGPLGPERSRSLELGLDRTLAGGTIMSATLFTLDTDNAIFFDPAAAPGFPFGGYRNDPGVTERRGLEISGSLPLSDRLLLTGSYTYTSTRIRATGQPLDRVPANDLSLALDAEITPRLSGRLSASHVSGLRDFGTFMPAYTVFNASIAYDLGRDTQLSLRIDNLLNTQYQHLRGYGTSDRAVYVGLRRSF
ncbi:MAG: TonB-dependent receptor [Rhodobacteraceae bacterium]|nr:TonB-dependent receptor [Paracoccaceae bacterium]